jgi:hypothetical protein
MRYRTGAFEAVDSQAGIGKPATQFVDGSADAERSSTSEDGDRQILS